MVACMASASADQGDDLDPVVLPELGLAVQPLGYQGAVHLDGTDRLLEAEPGQQVRHAPALGEFHRLSVHGHEHRSYPSRVRPAILMLVPCLALVACSKPAIDTGTPEALLEAVRIAVEDGRPEILPDLIDVPVREVEFADGVTEASAVEDVRGKLKDMLAQLWRVTVKLRDRFPGQVSKELAAAQSDLVPKDFREGFARFFADPFGELQRERVNLKVEDLGDGTAALLWKDEPLWGGAIAIEERSGGWRFVVPVELLRSNEYFPDTREEWAILASMMLGIENSLTDFERELDEGKFRDLKAASTRVGRLVGESVVVQSVIYAMMKRDEPGDTAK